jgi:hypothetical protein
MPHYGHYGEKNGNNRWTDAEAKEIREYRAIGFTYPDLKKMYGGSDGALHDLCHGISYKEAGGPIERGRGKRHRSVLK